MIQNLKKSFSFWAIVLYAIIAFTCRDSFRPYNSPQHIISYDMQGYYSYLPAFFIYKDYDFNFVNTKKGDCMKVPVLDKNGNKVIVNKYTVGPAILNAPFFLLGHLECYWQQVPRDGNSYVYLFWTMTGVMLYVIIALFLLRHILLKYYNEVAVGLTLLALGLGTNLLHYTIFEFWMSHAYSFFLFALALNLSINWLDEPRKRTFVLLSMVCGLIAVTRLPNMIYFFVIAFWGVFDKQSLVERLLLFKTHWASIALGFLFFLLPFLPQVAYWYHITGKFYVNPYGSNYEYIYWTHPMLAEILIGYRKGWLIYTPIMFFGIFGFITLYREQKEIFWTLFLFALMNIYVVSCWSNWWYGGSFGMRALIEGSVVFSLPMAAAFNYLGRNLFTSHLTVTSVVLFILLNMFQSYQYKHGVIHHCAMTRKAYWGVFGVSPPAHKYHMKVRDQHLLIPSVAEAKRTKYHQTIW